MFQLVHGVTFRNSAGTLMQTGKYPGSKLSDKGYYYLDKIDNASNRMYYMIEGVLAYSKINRSEQAIALVDLNEIMNSIETDLEILIQQKQACILAAPQPTIEGASVLIYELFYNLINK